MHASSTRPPAASTRSSGQLFDRGIGPAHARRQLHAGSAHCVGLKLFAQRADAESPEATRSALSRERFTARGNCTVRASSSLHASRRRPSSRRAVSGSNACPCNLPCVERSRKRDRRSFRPRRSGVRGRLASPAIIEAGASVPAKAPPGSSEATATALTALSLAEGLHSTDVPRRGERQPGQAAGAKLAVARRDAANASRNSARNSWSARSRIAANRHPATTRRPVLTGRRRHTLANAADS